jgi:hypothetical protein
MATWCLERPPLNADTAFLTRVRPQAGVPLVLLHMPTRVALLADPKQTEYTDFGAECEVVCQSVVPANVVTAMAREAKGSAIVTVPLEVSGDAAALDFAALPNSCLLSVF